jgi:hypothetical protein
MSYKKTTMRRAFIEVGDENFISIEQVASDPSMRAAAIASLKREIGRLRPAEKHVARNTLHFLRTVREGRTKGRGSIRIFFAAIGATLGGGALAIRKTLSGIGSAVREALGGMAYAIRWILGGIESAIRKTLGGTAFAIRWTFGGIESAIRKTLGGSALAIRWTLGGLESAIRRILNGMAFAIRWFLSGIDFAVRRIRGGGAHLFARMRRVFASGT